MTMTARFRSPHFLTKFILFRKQDLIVLGCALLGSVGIMWFLTEPLIGGVSRVELRVSYADSARLRTHVEYLATSTPPRTHDIPEGTARATEYIIREFTQYCDTVEIQPFVVDGSTQQNIRCFFDMTRPTRIVVGAHYDVFGYFPGADDNASGIAGILELARLIRERGGNKVHGVELVAYATEESPYYGTEYMGSALHAQSISATSTRGVYILEMIGYFDASPGSQEYPMWFLRPLYPSSGDFVAMISRFEQRKFLRESKRRFFEATDIDLRSLTFFASSPIVQLSDHISYWNRGIDAIMITDTALHRNANYHTAGDIPATLDYVSMGKVVDGVFGIISTIP